MSHALIVLAQTPTFLERLGDPFTGANFLINFLVLGALYSLLAIGFVITFKATQVLNFAHGAIAALGAYFTFLVAVEWDIPGRFFAADHPINSPSEAFLSWELFGWLVSLFLALLVAAALGWVLERLFIEPMVGEPLFSVAIITLGLEIMLRTLYNDAIGVVDKQVGDPFLFKSWQIPIGDQSVTLLYSQPFIVLFAIVSGAVLAWFFRTRTGVAMRATAFDQEAAMVQGIPVNRIFAVAWMIAAVLAGIAGTMFALAPCPCGATPVLPFIAFRALPAVVVGGLDSITGAVVGGFLVAFIEIFLGTYFGFLSEYVGSGFGAVVPYVVMFVFLIFKPYGLFGTEEIRRV